MTLKARVIPCLDVKDGRVVKGVNFVDLIDAGDPVEAARAYMRRAQTNCASSTSRRLRTIARQFSMLSPVQRNSASCR